MREAHNTLALNYTDSLPILAQKLLYQIDRDLDSAKNMDTDEMTEDRTTCAGVQTEETSESLTIAKLQEVFM